MHRHTTWGTGCSVSARLSREIITSKVAFTATTCTACRVLCSIRIDRLVGGFPIGVEIEAACPLLSVRPISGTRGLTPDGCRGC